MPRNLALTIAGAISVVAAIALWRARQSSLDRGARPPMAVSGQNVDTAGVTSPSYSPQEMAKELETHSHGAIDSATAILAWQFLQDATDAYTADTPVRFVAFSRRQGLEPHEGFTGADAVSNWRSRASALIGAHFDLRNAAAAWRPYGEVVARDKLPRGMKRLSSAPGASRGPEDVERPSPSTLALVVSVPANIRRQDGTPVNAEIRYVLVRSRRGYLVNYGIQMFVPATSESAPIIQPPL
jgi:hypothetical protein